MTNVVNIVKLLLTVTSRKIYENASAIILKSVALAVIQGGMVTIANVHKTD